MTHLYSDHRRILLIDQAATRRNLRATILRHHEIEVHTAGSLTEAAALCRTQAYDLVLLAAQENSDEAMAASVQIRAVKPGQRIGLLVGPPTFLRELGGKRKKVKSVRAVLPRPAAENPSEPVSLPPASSPQWQETIRRLVSDWYGDQSTLLGLHKLADRVAGA